MQERCYYPHFIYGNHAITYDTLFSQGVSFLKSFGMETLATFDKGFLDQNDTGYPIPDIRTMATYIGYLLRLN